MEVLISYLVDFDVFCVETFFRFSSCTVFLARTYFHLKRGANLHARNGFFISKQASWHLYSLSILWLL